MSIYGLQAANVIRSICRDLGDEEAKNGGKVERLLNDAILRLAEAECFRRKELIAVAAGVPEYGLTGEVRRIIRVAWDNKRIRRKSEDLLDAEHADWRTHSGDPEAWTGERRVRLVPSPSGSGTVLTIPGTGAITSSEGHRITGADYWLCKKTGNDLFFLPGDGNVTNADASGNMLVDYAYYPAELDNETIVPFRFVMPLTRLVRAMFLRTVPADDPRYQSADALEKTFTDTVQGLQAVYTESTVKPAEQLPGDATGKALSIPKDVLLQSLSEAVAKGQPIPAEVIDALQRDYVHGLTADSEELINAMPWSYVQGVIQEAAASGKPIPAIIVEVFRLRRPEIEEGAAARPLWGEAFWSSGYRRTRTYYDGVS